MDRKKPGTYALVLRCLRKKKILIGKLGALKLRIGYYIYVGSAFGPGGVFARVNHHRRILKSYRWHIDYLIPAVEIVDVWYSRDPKKREHQWADALMGISGVEIPLQGFGSSDCRCRAHLFFFDSAITFGMFRTRIKAAIPNHHNVERVTDIKKPQAEVRKN